MLAGGRRPCARRASATPGIASEPLARLEQRLQAACQLSGQDGRHDPGPAPEKKEGPVTRAFVVGARGIEPLTSSASRKRSTPELSARAPDPTARDLEARPGIEPVYRVVKPLAYPLGHPAGTS